MNEIIDFLIASSLSRSSYYKNFVATLSKASFGHGKYQSIIVLFTRAGNWRALLLRDYPGEKQIHICNFCFTLSIYQFQQFVLSLESTFPSDLTLPLIPLIIYSF